MKTVTADISDFPMSKVDCILLNLKDK